MCRLLAVLHAVTWSANGLGQRPCHAAQPALRQPRMAWQAGRQAVSESNNIAFACVRSGSGRQADAWVGVVGIYLCSACVHRPAPGARARPPQTCPNFFASRCSVHTSHRWMDRRPEGNLVLSDAVWSWIESVQLQFRSSLVRGSVPERFRVAEFGLKIPKAHANAKL